MSRVRFLRLVHVLGDADRRRHQLGAMRHNAHLQVIRTMDLSGHVLGSVDAAGQFFGFLAGVDEEGVEL